MGTRHDGIVAPHGLVEAAHIDEGMRIIAHPDFPRAARALATNMLSLATDDEVLGTVFKDAGRYLTAMLVGYLHVMGGMTLARLKTLCATSGFLSPGRARSLLQFLLHIGYIAPAGPHGTGRAGTPAAYAPTPLYFAAWQAHALAALSAAEIIEPRIAALNGRITEPGVFDAFLAVQAGRLHERARTSDATPPFFRIFTHRYAGSLMVMRFIEAGGDDAFPSAEPIPISLAAAARRFGVSHMHIRRMLTDARRAGLLLYDAKGTVRLEEEAQIAIRFFYASQLAELVTSATTTLAQLRDPRPI